VKESVDVVA
jgi:hypothetical protein